MKKFFVTFLASAEAVNTWKAMDKEDMKEGMQEWNAWFTAHASMTVDKGSSLGKTKRVDMQGIADGKNELIGYMVVEAQSIEEAAKMFTDHPNAKMEGCSVEVMEVLDLPKM